MKQQRPLTGGMAGGNMAGPWGPAGPRTTPMMPSQQNFQQNQAAMPSAQATTPMAGGGIYNPMPRATQGPANPMSMQGPAMPARLDASHSGGTHWQGRENLYGGGGNNWLSQPQGWRGSNPGVVSPEKMAQLQSRVGNLQGLMRGVQGDIRQGTRNPEAMGLLQNRMGRLQDYKRWMGQHTAANTPAAAPGPVDPVTGLPVDPNMPGGVASDFSGGLTNAGNLASLLAGLGYV
jgi:hypothetical protein